MQTLGYESNMHQNFGKTEAISLIKVLYHNATLKLALQAICIITTKDPQIKRKKLFLEGT